MVLSALFAGIILANLVIAASTMFNDVSPVPIDTPILYLAGLFCGFVIGVIVAESKRTVVSVFSAVSFALFLFSMTILIATWLSGFEPFMDVMLLFAFRQSAILFLFLLMVGFLGGIGADLVGAFWEKGV